ncbi:hypothetical protein M8494_37170 [Serratia ureilytica]
MKGYQRRYYPYGSASPTSPATCRRSDRDVERLDKRRQPNYAATHDIGKLGIERYYEDRCTAKPVTKRLKSTTAAG